MNKNMQANQNIYDEDMKAYNAHMEAIGYYISPPAEGMPHHRAHESSYYFSLDEYGGDDDLPAAFLHVAHDDTDHRNSIPSAIRVPVHTNDLKGTQYSDVAIDFQKPSVEKLRICVDKDLSDTCDETHDDSTGFEVDLTSESGDHFYGYVPKIRQVEA